MGSKVYPTLIGVIADKMNKNMIPNDKTTLELNEIKPPSIMENALKTVVTTY